MGERAAGREHLVNGQRVGVISDTHGILRPEVLEVFRGVQMIIHAGDVGRPEVLSLLREVAPVVAVRGNVDRGEWASSLPETEVVSRDDVRIYVIHDLTKIDLDPVAAGIKAVIYGHSHKPLEERQQGVLFLNPGSAGPSRFFIPVSLAILHIEKGNMDVEFVSLGQRGGTSVVPPLGG